MTNGLDEFAPQAFLDVGAASFGEQDLCLRLEVLLVKMQDRQPQKPVIPGLAEKLNRLGHRLVEKSVPGLDYFFEGPVGENRVMEIRGAGEWVSVRVRLAARDDSQVAL